MGSSRQMKDKKTNAKSVRLTDEQVLKAEKQAKELDMRFSTYVGYLIDKDSAAVTPEVMTKIQNITNTARIIAGNTPESKIIQKEIDELWSLLK